jgi:hypothetical protein
LGFAKIISTHSGSIFFVKNLDNLHCPAFQKCFLFSFFSGFCLARFFAFFFVFKLIKKQLGQMRKGKQTLKKIVMLKNKIKTHKSGKMYNQPHFFILNKGLNSGKPFNHYVVNSFVFLADNKEEKEFYYFLLLGLWELRFFRKHLKGSVIEYVRLGDVIDVIDETLNSVNSGNRSFSDVQNTLAQIEALQANLQTQLNYLMQLRKSLFYKYLKSN